MKIIAIILIVVLLSVAAVVVFREPIVKFAIGRAVQHLTGFSVSIETLRLGLGGRVVEAGGMKVYNPAEFEDRLFLDVPSFMARYDLGRVLKGEYYLDEFSLYVREFQVIRRADGSTNVGRMSDSVIALKPKDEGPAKLPNIKVKTLKLKVDKVVLKDYSFRPPAIKIYDVKLEKKFENIDDPRELVRLIVVQSLLKSGVKDLMDVDLAGLRESVTSVLKTETGAVFEKLDAGVAQGAVEAFKGLFDPAETNTSRP
ncbi:MAG: hypothetical protein WC732_01625 [Candidatus Omnitrophota bacterium]